jgi:hypothetical protein
MFQTDQNRCMDISDSSLSRVPLCAFSIPHRGISMAIQSLSHADAAAPYLAPVQRRYAPVYSFVLLVTASALASLAFACATPFATFAVIVAAMLPVRSALLVVAAAWLVNQGIGFGLHHYPIDRNTILWGLTIGAAALAATVAATWILSALPRAAGVASLGLAFTGAYAAYEIVLYAVTPILGDAGAFTAAIIARLAVLNILWTIGLIAVCAITSLLSTLRHTRALS